MAKGVLSMLIGVGVDLVSIPRIGKVYRRFPDRFLRRILTPREEELLRRRRDLLSSLAARFAAKEAVLKAIGCGIGPAAMREVEVISAPGRPPRVQLHGRAAALARKRGIAAVAVSLTHESPFAGAVAAAYGIRGDL